jgi:hypothetical protein
MKTSVPRYPTRARRMQMRIMKLHRAHQLSVVASLFAQFAAVAGDPLDHWHQIGTSGILPSGAIEFGAGKYLGLDGVHLLVSTNLRDWAITRTFGSDEQPTDLGFSDGLWVLTGQRQRTNIFILTSANGEIWSSAASSPRGEVDYYWPQVRRSPDEWIITTGSTNFLRSADGQTWTWSWSDDGARDLTYTDGFWVSIGHGSTPVTFCCIVASTNNFTDSQWWRPWPLPAGSTFYSLRFAHGLWFGTVGPASSVGETPETSIVTSTDGTNWTTRYVGPGLSDLRMINGRLLAVSFTSSTVSGAGAGPMLDSDPLISLQSSGPGNLTLRRASGIPLALEWSDDFRHWSTLTRVPFGDPTETFTDPAARNAAARFYRARTP